MEETTKTEKDETADGHLETATEKVEAVQAQDGDERTLKESNALETDLVLPTSPSRVSDTTSIHEEPWLLDKILVIIKPDAVKHINAIFKIIKSYAFEMVQERKVTLTPEQASEFYEDQYGTPHFPLLVTYMSSGPIVALCLVRKNAIKIWRIIMGPTSPSEARRDFPESLRAKFGHKKDEFRNAVHGSDSPQKASREIRFFFPEMINEPIPMGDSLVDYLSNNVNAVLIRGLTELCRGKPVDPVIWLADWLIMHNPNRPITDERMAFSDV